MVLQAASSREDPVEAAGLHNGIAEAARDLYRSELRSLRKAPYTPQLADYHMSRLMHVFVFHIYTGFFVVATSLRFIARSAH